MASKLFFVHCEKKNPGEGVKNDDVLCSFSDTKFSLKIRQSGAIRTIFPILKHLSGKVGSLYPILQVSLNNELLYKA